MQNSGGFRLWVSVGLRFGLRGLRVLGFRVEGFRIHG